MFSHTDTKPQKIVNNILQNLNIKYTNEKIFGSYSADNYLDDYNLIIEVMGDFWHTNPLTNKISYPLQEKRIVCDYKKRCFIKTKYNINILYLWENNLYKNLNVCLELIKLYLSFNGVLQNYNSFNYHLCNNTIELNNNIFSAFFEDENIVKQLERQYYKNP